MHAHPHENYTLCKLDHLATVKSYNIYFMAQNVALIRNHPRVSTFRGGKTRDMGGFELTSSACSTWRQSKHCLCADSVIFLHIFTHSPHTFRTYHTTSIHECIYMCVCLKQKQELDWSMREWLDFISLVYTGRKAHVYVWKNCFSREIPIFCFWKCSLFFMKCKKKFSQNELFYVRSIQTFYLTKCKLNHWIKIIYL